MRRANDAAADIFLKVSGRENQVFALHFSLGLEADNAADKTRLCG